MYGIFGGPELWERMKNETPELIDMKDERNWEESVEWLWLPPCHLSSVLDVLST
jgi:hypothetical protein